MDDSKIEDLGLNGLRHRCQEESALFFRRLLFDPRFCFEIFRRAIVLRNGEAWDCLYCQYHDLVLGWVSRHPLAKTLDEDAEYFINRAFEKLWAGITPQRFDQFPDLKFLLRYLQMCVHSVIVDYARAREQAELIEDDREPENLLFQENQQREEGVEKQVAGKLFARELWDQINLRLKTDQERVVMTAMMVLDLKPREIIETFQGVFKNIDEVYMVKENLFSRLRRDRQLFQVLTRLEEVGQDDGEKSESVREKPARAGKTNSRYV